MAASFDAAFFIPNNRPQSKEPAKLYAYFSAMTSVVIIGTGNVARHIFDVFHARDQIDVIQVAGRNKRALSYFKERANISEDLENLQAADIYMLAVTDEAIGSVGEQMSNHRSLFVHTSGSTPIDILPNHGRRGVFYPLQTFSREMKVNFRTVPICIEAESEKDYKILEGMASEIDSPYYRVNSEQRLHLHTAAVFVNNFTNHLYHVGYTLCENQGISKEILNPLIAETVHKLEYMTPLEAQTGPARRGDLTTIGKQINIIDQPLYKDIYDSISKSIQATYAEKL